LPFKAFLAVTLFAAILALNEARGAVASENPLLLGADFGKIGWLCTTIVVKPVVIY
jgi:hypothetical protein